ncbi:hypothetical protein [Aquimarina macrocephali]|uniref:hypothetical protein n=1 Tax=Aquimarina macrocephali TaxID=666563 RepID=UPI000466DC37|nr:hypothetical protein [Aquimarina macrocephali]
MIEERLKVELNSELDKLAYKRRNIEGLTGFKDYALELKKYFQYTDNLYTKYSSDLDSERFAEIVIETTNSRNSDIRID